MRGPEATALYGSKAQNGAIVMYSKNPEKKSRKKDKYLIQYFLQPLIKFCFRHFFFIKKSFPCFLIDH